MFIQVEETPNPNSMKFILGYDVTNPAETFEFVKDASIVNPFAKSMFDISGVQKIFASQNFITVTKAEDSTWETLNVKVIGAIMDGSNVEKIFFSDKVIVESEAPAFEGIAKEIKELIAERVRPAVAMDGGDIQFVKFDESDGIVYVRMHGACNGCPSSSATLNSGIKSMLQYYIPEVVDVMLV